MKLIENDHPSMGSHVAPELPDFFQDLVKSPKMDIGMPDVSRRDFFKLSGVAGGGLVIGLSMGTSSKAKAQSGAETSTLSPYVQIQINGRINLFSKNPECGQGIKTGLPLIIAEELDCAWEDVDVVQADIDGSKYGAQFAGGSLSTPQNWMAMRHAGATARAMILAAAAQQLNIPVSELSTSDTRVLHATSERDWAYGEFAELAATMEVPATDSLTLKTRDEFKLLGRRFTGVDNVEIVTGQPLFGADTHMEGMLYASYSKCPQIGGRALSFNEDHIKSLPGVVDAFIIDENGNPKVFSPGGGDMFSGVAVVAENTWAAIKAKRELEVEWDLSNAEVASWDDLVARAYALQDQDGDPLMVNQFNGPGNPPAQVSADKGDAEGVLGSAETVVSSFYEYPYVSHAQLEPETCVAKYENGSVEIWAPAQIPQGGEAGSAILLGIPVEEAAERVVLHQTRIGGGFGRKLANDYVFEVVSIARRMEGIPIKLQWTREDDMSGDYFRPGGFHSYSAGLDSAGNLTAWQDHFITSTGNDESPMTSANLNPDVFPMDVIDNVKLTQTMFHNAIPTGPMRAPSSNAFAFSFQSFMHELAVASGKGHVEFLMDTLGESRLVNPENPRTMHTGRAANVISEVARLSGYEQGANEPGRGKGLSFYFCHSGYVAQVADVSVSANKELKVHKGWAVADFGFIHNLNGAENQMEGGIIDGISQLFNAKITFNNGVIQQQNFHQYPLARMPQTPELEVAFLEPEEFSPSGGGEPSMPPVLAAVTNAIYSATGERIRKMPLFESGYKLV
ncbi:MAG: molybdopterin cofactor-binding domain-containing protein [Pseudomonadales bacterium]